MPLPAPSPAQAQPAAGEAAARPKRRFDDGLTLKDFIPGPRAENGVFTAKCALGNAERGAPTEDQVIEALRAVYDPEIPVNLYDLGLIYRIGVDGHDVRIDMTLTAPGCPVAGTLPGQVAERVAQVPGVRTAAVTLVWDPPWSKDRMSEDARLALDMF
ncbi:MAG: SUF system Fe-S cluster assembly protein [Alphaproteobacteria bacterium]|nr:SUF system Fe-S cluster assembly protein [Alphaproteobacteria bacterium]